ncbi:MAG: glycoside hydrolase family 30 beta sandwich domain-containing protein [Candidatus Hydrogenedentales bacterium]|jgi:O-glycosyl hydrolase
MNTYRFHISFSSLLIIFGACLLAVTPVKKAQATTDVSFWLSTQDGKKQLSREMDIAWEEPCPCDPLLVRVTAATTYQPVLGLGSSWDHATCENLFKLPETTRNEVIKKLVCPIEGIGMNLMRLCIGASDFIGEAYYTYDDLPAGQTDPELTHFSIEKDRAYLIPVIKKSMEYNPDILFFASPWSPPAWMKTSGTLGGGSVKPEYYDLWALYLARYIEAYAAEGIPIHAITLQNEPRMSHKDYPTTLWTGEEQRDFIKDHLGPLFKEQGIKTAVWCWDHNWNNLDFPRTIIANPASAVYVEGTAFHLYEGKVSAQKHLKENYPDKDIFFTEGSVFGAAGASLITDIFRNWSRSYNAWVTILDEKRQPNRGPHKADATCIELKQDLSVQYRSDYFLYGQFMKFIQRDAVRINSDVKETRLFNHIAFQNPDGSILFIAVNASRSPQAFSIEWEQRIARSELPSRSVGTFIWFP